jgi:hypothetical protein
MALSNAERQRRWRARRNDLVRTNPAVVEAELMADVKCCDELSARARAALADRLTVAAFGHWRAAAGRLLTGSPNVRLAPKATEVLALPRIDSMCH